MVQLNVHQDAEIYDDYHDLHEHCRCHCHFHDFHYWKDDYHHDAKLVNFLLLLLVNNKHQAKHQANCYVVLHVLLLDWKIDQHSQHSDWQEHLWNIAEKVVEEEKTIDEDAGCCCDCGCAGGGGC